MPPPTGKAIELGTRDTIRMEELGREDRSTFRDIDLDVDRALDAILQTQPSPGNDAFAKAPLERLSALAEGRGSPLTAGQQRLFQSDPEPMAPGFEAFDVLRTLYEFEAATSLVKDYATEPAFEGLRRQVEELESVLSDFGSDISVDAERAEYLETARQKMADAAGEIVATGDLSVMTKLDLELALDDARMAIYRLGQEAYAPPVSGPVDALVAGASAASSGADLADWLLGKFVSVFAD